MNIIKTIVKLFIFLAVVALGNTLQIANAQAPVLTKTQALTYRSEDTYVTRMNQWINRLSQAESGNDPNLVYLDVNDRYSYSCLQFQKETWDTYSRKYGIHADIMDCNAQKELAYAMISHDYSAWVNWYNSVKFKIGYPPRTT